MTKQMSFRFSDEVAQALDELAERYSISKTAVVEHLILDRNSVSNKRKNSIRMRKAAIDSGAPISDFIGGYRRGWLDFQTRHETPNPMVEEI